MVGRLAAITSAMGVSALLTAALIGVSALAPPGAIASDASVTETYLRADLALVTAGRQHLPASIAGYRGVLTKVRSQCPRAALNSPQNPESSQLSDEVIGTMVLSAGKPDLAAIAAFLHAVRGMQWSSGAVTHAVSSYTAMLGKLYKMQIPDLCGDVGRWSSNGFASLPSSTLSFDRAFLPNWVALGLVPPGIGRFESAGSRSLARRANGLEQQLTDAEAQAVETYGSIMDALELNQ